MTDAELIATIRLRHPYLSDDWEAAVKLELGKKRTADKCRAKLRKMLEGEKR